MKTPTLGRAWPFMFIVLLVGCAADAEEDPEEAAGPAADPPSADPASDPEPDSSAGAPAPRPLTGGFEVAIAHDWEVAAGVEHYYCAYETLTEDVWVSDFRPLSPPGTHHVTLGFQNPGPPDGVIEAGDPDAPALCNGLTFGEVYVYSAAVGTQGLSLPEGVATRIPAGKQMVLSTHVFNATEAPLGGRSGIEIVRRDRASVMHEAEQIAALDSTLEVPPGKSTHTSRCTMEADATILAAFGHMHETGVHFTTTALPSGGEPIVVLDHDYVFEDQTYELLDEPVRLATGDVLEVECELGNPGSTTLTFGESTGLNEMCITFFYRYPAVATNSVCSE